KLPSSKDGVQEPIRIAAVGLAAAEWKTVDAHKIQAVSDIHSRGTVVSMEIVSVLHRGEGLGAVRSAIVSGRVGHRFGPRIVERVFESVMSSLPQTHLSGVVI